MVNTHFIVQFHALLSMNNQPFTVQAKASMLADIHRDSFNSCQGFLLVKFSGSTTADRKLELSHIAPVHSTTCFRYVDRLLAQNTIYLVDKSLLNIKLHLPTWQQLTVCETSVNPDQRFCFWMPCAYCALAAGYVWLGRTCAVAYCQQQNQHGASLRRGLRRWE